MMIEEDFLEVNEFSRPGKIRTATLGVVMHWTANPNANAKQNKEYFDAKKLGMDGYGSAHYIVSQDGSIVQCMPENEVAYHCGTDRLDPESHAIYTNYARAKFKQWALHPDKTSPNWCTIGIEMCPTDWEGHFSKETLDSAAELCSIILQRHNLTVDDICTHNMVVGWKDCPKLWCDEPERFIAFKSQVAAIIRRRSRKPSLLYYIFRFIRKVLCGNS